MINRRVTGWVCVALAACVLPVGLLGPSWAQDTRPQDHTSSPVVLDGVATEAEWAGRSMRQDAEFLYFRLTLPEALTLQGTQTPVALRIDADHDATTGRPLGELGGVDLSIVFSPPPAPETSDAGISPEALANVELPEPGQILHATDHVVLTALSLQEDPLTHSVRGRVSDARTSPTGKVFRVDFAGVSPQNGFQVVYFTPTFEAMQAKFGGENGDGLAGQEVLVTGPVTRYRGRPQIIVDDADQVERVDSEAAQAMLDEAAATNDADVAQADDAEDPHPQATQDAAQPQRAKFAQQLEVAVNPGARGMGVAVQLFEPNGRNRDLGHADVDLIFAPTYAATTFELRLSRHKLAKLLPQLDTPANLPVHAALVRMPTQKGPAGQVERWQHLDPQPDATQPGALMPEAAVPDKPDDAIRIVSHNVLRSSPMGKPKPFARLYQALKPDVILIQEWDDISAGLMASWFRHHVSLSTPWQALTGPGGVALVSRHPIQPGQHEDIYIAGESADGPGWPVRLATAVVQAPGGDVRVGSLHLKCCGYAGSEEDLRRIAEAAAIRQALQSIRRDHHRHLVLGGDVNLVGSRDPLDVLLDDLDADGSDLTPAKTRVLGDRATYTWRSDRSRFSPGRLDWLWYTDATMHPIHAFVLDSEKLPQAELDRLGLRKTDTAASDHLPLVVDLRPLP